MGDGDCVFLVVFFFVVGVGGCGVGVVFLWFLVLGFFWGFWVFVVLLVFHGFCYSCGFLVRM